MKKILKIAALAGLGYGGYKLYQKYLKQPKENQEFADVSAADFEYDKAAKQEETFADKIKAAAIKQLERL